MEETIVSKSNRSQTVHLPKVMVLPEDVKHVNIVAVGRTHIMIPAGESWDSWFDGESVTSDFMAAHGQPGDQDREGF